MAPEEEPNLNRRKYITGAVAAALGAGLGARALKARSQPDVAVPGTDRARRNEVVGSLEDRNTAIGLEIVLLKKFHDVDIEQINSGITQPAITSLYTSDSMRANAAAALALIVGAAGGGSN